jgi:hypothetical protein
VTNRGSGQSWRPSPLGGGRASQEKGRLLVPVAVTGFLLGADTAHHLSDEVIIGGVMGRCGSGGQHGRNQQGTQRNGRHKQEGVGVCRNHRTHVQWVNHRGEPSGTPIKEWANERRPNGSADKVTWLYCSTCGWL